MEQATRLRCNICGGEEFTDMPGRPKVRCAGCGSLERTRVCALRLQGDLKPRPGASVLHFAPERGLSQLLRRISGAYRAVDIAPENYPGLGVEKFDLCRDVFDLPESAYDVIVLNHVLEHIECNYSAVLLRLARSLTDDGVMLFSVPVEGEEFRDAIALGTLEEKAARFGAFRHYRNFGRAFIAETLGMLFRLPERYDLTRHVPEEKLVEAAIRPHHWRKITGATVFAVRKADARV
ncbi:methyltransferase domain-containing protein [Camelimonas abortus]|uniref:Methyltransferase domain-containing protein n=1 Tax=Camelimonas abortus TaxID=1017184 RepID=A0ABV7LFT6_9HYPH